MRRFFTPVLVSALSAWGQQTRTDELETQRSQHAVIKTPETNSGAENFLRWVKDERMLQRLNYGYNGLGLKLGGLVTGGGFAFGPQYLRDDLKDGQILVNASAQISFQNYQKLNARFVMPKLLNDKAFFGVQGTYFNYPGINYYGPGPDSQKVRTNYRLENTAVDGTAGIKIQPWLRVGGGAGYLAVNTGPGNDDRFSSTDQLFPPVLVPGIDRQANFLRYGVFGQIDYRDDQFAARQGGNYVVQYTRYNDQKFGTYSFNLLDIDLQQYIGFLNKSRVFALRAHTKLTDPLDNNFVPFYLQPVVGGPDDLRGFRAFRFSGRNSLVLNGEYRWAIFSGCDGAVFVDGGKVFNNRGQLNFKDLEGSVGFGLRFNARNRTFMRFDVGFSHEGVQVWFKFSDSFFQRPMGTADSQPIL